MDDLHRSPKLPGIPKTAKLPYQLRMIADNLVDQSRIASSKSLNMNPKTQLSVLQGMRKADADHNKDTRENFVSEMTTNGSRYPDTSRARWKVPQEYSERQDASIPIRALARSTS